MWTRIGLGCALWLAGCETLLVSDLGRAPEIVRLSVSPQEVLLDPLPPGPDGRVTVTLRVEADIRDPDGNLQDVRVWCRDPYQEAVSAEAELTRVGQDRYAGELLLRLARGAVGQYTVYAQARDRRNRVTNIPRVELLVRATGSPPRILEVRAPSEVRIPAQGSRFFEVAAWVEDPDGPETIARVYLVTPTGQEIDLYDDGRVNETGDQRAGDGLYTRRLSVSSANAPGRYSFTFYAVDRAGLRSEPRLHVIELIP
ncbi:MAG: hypothetical protein N2561_00165 [Bacteroidetes bacterium]|nr:hypothetical protein [Rhodothermia bacterium]MCS7155935.1 hypothetical protein [Bacteroidota bacterium]MCX7905941.1 hypothetical protein [Bacteroidota bacterium]MDW8138092.1 hypothetical protein [Bacteroidota bacterium]MDW8285776.1 hypothetical protein [Bacteroidota bacterium]